MAFFSLRHQLQLFLVGFAILLVSVTLGATYVVSKNNFIEYLNRVQQQTVMQAANQLSLQYGNNAQRWQSFTQTPRGWGDFVVQFQHANFELDFDHTTNQAQETAFNMGSSNQSLSPNELQHNIRPLPLDLILFNAKGQHLYGPTAQTPDQLYKTPIYDSTHSVMGYVGIINQRHAQGILQTTFLKTLQRTFVITLLVALLLALMLAIPLSNYLLHPIQRINVALKHMGKRNFSGRLTVDAKGELGDLQRVVNQLANDLEYYERTQKQWLGHLSHDLRTPLTILKVHLESMQHGILPMHTDQIGSLQHEVESLSHMLDQFHQYAVSQIVTTNFALQPINVLDVINKTTQQFEPVLAENHLQLKISKLTEREQEVMVLADATLLQRIFNNIMQNCIRYTDAGGLIDITIQCNSATVTMSWQDTAPGVPEDSLALLGSPLYRLEKSRNRSFAGNGLGLAIVVQYMNMLSGSVQFSHSALGGLCVTLDLPKYS